MSNVVFAANLTGSDHLENCTLAIRQSEGETMSVSNLNKAIYCITYIAGFLDGIGAVQSVKPQTRLICVPVNGISSDQGIRIFVKHLRNSPETLHEAGRVELFIALARAFPCSK